MRAGVTQLTLNFYMGTMLPSNHSLPLVCIFSSFCGLPYWGEATGCLQLNTAQWGMAGLTPAGFRAARP